MTKKKIAFVACSVVLLTTLVAGAMFGQAAEKTSVYRYLSIFSEVFDLVRSNYVEQVSSEALMDGAFAGVTDAIDEFSYYVPPTEMAAYKQRRDEDDNPFGLILTKRFGYAYVVTPVAGSPAEKAGIEGGDFVEKIDGKSTQNMALWQLRGALQQERPVKLQILRGGATEREQITIEPGEVHPVKISAKVISGIGYLKVPYFEPGTAASLRASLDELRGQGVRKLIIDVRGNAGGSIEEAIKAADDLLSSGTITSLAGRKVETKTWQADRETAWDGEVEVLVDQSTAAGAELFASAIRGNGRGKTIGVTTFGKAIEQRFVELPSGGGVRMTVARYTTPDLKSITDVGIKPDVVVDLTPQVLDPEGSEDDLILEKALELFGVDKAEAKKAA